MSNSAAIYGCLGHVLTAEERAFFAEVRPWGFILFRRNVDSPEQVLKLTSDLRDAVGWDAPVLVDQEGGRVQRLGPPHWCKYPPGETFRWLITPKYITKEVVPWKIINHWLAFNKIETGDEIAAKEAAEKEKAAAQQKAA